MTVRPATRADVAALAALEQAAFGAATAWSDRTVLAEVQGGHRIVLVADGEEGPDGWVCVQLAHDVADLTRIAVHPRRRRTGLARLLLSVVDDLARERGAVRMLLEVADDNLAAARLYETHGFTSIASRRSYYADGSDAIVMERTLARHAS